MSHHARLGDRSLFPYLSSQIYLNHAAISPPSLPVREATLGMLDAYAARGAAAVTASFNQRDRLKLRLAGLIGARAEELGLVPSTTWGLSCIAHGLRWQAGDRVVLFQGEFPANVTPWLSAAKQFGLDVRWVDTARFHESEAAGLREVDRALEGGARLMAVSFVQFRDGLRMPLRALSERVHAAGGELCVDAIQGVGVVPLDVAREGVDYLACGAHKWLLALEGAGFLFVRGALAERLEPRLAGWLSHEDPLDFLIEGVKRLRYDKPLQRTASVFEVGSANALGFAALEASVELIGELGVEAIYEHVQRYHDALEGPLQALGLVSLRSREPAQRSGSLSFELASGGSVLELAASLREAGIACSTPDGALRFSPHWPNAQEEVPHVVDAVARALSK